MISLTPSAAAPVLSTLTAMAGRARDARTETPDKSTRATLPSTTQIRDQSRAQLKEMAGRKLQAVRDRMKALSLMVKIDPKSALKLAGDLAKELKAAVKAYVEAGGRNVSDGEMAMLRKRAADARDASNTAAEAVPNQPKTEAGDEAANVPVDAETRRAQQAYAAAVDVADSKDAAADVLDGVEDVAIADQGFFQQVKELLGGLKKAREDIRAAAPYALSKPDEDDWKAADRAQAELEREIDFAPTGAPEPPMAAPTSVHA